MDVLVLIDKLDDLVHNAKGVMMTDQVRVDKEEIYDILDQMRATIPEEIKQARWIVKGLRAISDFEYELEMNQLNRMQAPDIESVYLMASAKYSFIRSSGVKELATFGGAIEDLVPEEVAVALKERVGRRRTEG